jgi:DNA-binding NarL/FixJ family response regulator
MPDSIRILIADDHPVVRKELRSFLETYPDMAFVAEAENGAQAVELTREYVANLVLMDRLMPEVNGVEAIDRSRTSAPPSASSS